MILHIACFITLCEAFLCVEAHFGLWRRYFQVKLQTNVNETCECGGATIYKQAESEYLAGDFSETNKTWQEEWFYVRDVELDNPPQSGMVTPFSQVPQVKRHS